MAKLGQPTIDWIPSHMFEENEHLSMMPEIINALEAGGDDSFVVVPAHKLDPQADIGAGVDHVWAAMSQAGIKLGKHQERQLRETLKTMTTDRAKAFVAKNGLQCEEILGINPDGGMMTWLVVFN